VPGEDVRGPGPQQSPGRPPGQSRRSARDRDHALKTGATRLAHKIVHLGTGLVENHDPRTRGDVRTQRLRCHPRMRTVFDPAAAETRTVGYEKLDPRPEPVHARIPVRGDGDARGQYRPTIRADGTRNGRNDAHLHPGEVRVQDMSGRESTAS